MGIIEYSKSAFLAFDFSGSEIRIFNQKKRQIAYLLLSLNFYELVMSIFHAWNNNNIYRFYLGAFMMTPSYYQALFDWSTSVVFLSMVRMYVYLVISNYREDFRKFQWIGFLRIEDEQTLIREHYFSPKEASSYLRLIGLFMKFIRINQILFWNGCFGVMGWMLYMAYDVIPFRWFLLSTLPNVVVFMFNGQINFKLYNYFVLIFFTNAMFIRKSLRSLASQALWRYKLKKGKLRQLAKQNLVQFNFIIRNFQHSQRSFNYMFCYSAGLILICFSYPFILLFTNLDLLSFLSTLSLYVQAMAITIWLLIKINGYVIHAMHDYSNYLHLLIYECPSVSLKLKLGNFFMIHQSHNRIGYKYMLQMWSLDNSWFLTFILESVSIVILIYSFNYFRTISL